MLPVTPGYDRTSCPKCNYVHDQDNSDRGLRGKWVNTQHALDRYTWKTITSQDWANGDIVADRDGDLWMHWNGNWVDPSDYVGENPPSVCRLAAWADGVHANGYMETSLPNYEPYAVWHLMPRLNRPPAFASLAEAEAWLDENGR